MNEMHKCCTCGQKVSVYSGEEGTNSYVGEEFKAGLERAAEICDELVRRGYTMASVGAHLCAAAIRKEGK